LIVLFVKWVDVAGGGAVVVERQACGSETRATDRMTDKPTGMHGATAICAEDAAKPCRGGKM